MVYILAYLVSLVMDELVVADKERTNADNNQAKATDETPKRNSRAWSGPVRTDYANNAGNGMKDCANSGDHHEGSDLAHVGDHTHASSGGLERGGHDCSSFRSVGENALQVVRLLAL